jgi:hypothetical protein
MGGYPFSGGRLHVPQCAVNSIFRLQTESLKWGILRAERVVKNWGNMRPDLSAAFAALLRWPSQSPIGETRYKESHTWL